MLHNSRPYPCCSSVGSELLLYIFHTLILYFFLTTRFRPAKAREMIAAVLSSRLAGSMYNPDKMSVVSKEIADEIKQRLKGGLAEAF